VGSFVAYGISKLRHFKNRKEETEAKIIFLLTWTHSGIQILQRIFPASNIQARFVIDMSSIVKVKGTFTLSINASLVSHVLCNYLITSEEQPIVYFPSYLKTKISASEAHLLSSFAPSFKHFSLKFGENVAQ